MVACGQGLTCTAAPDAARAVAALLDSSADAGSGDAGSGADAPPQILVAPPSPALLVLSASFGFASTNVSPSFANICVNLFPLSFANLIFSSIAFAFVSLTRLSNSVFACSSFFFFSAIN